MNIERAQDLSNTKLRSQNGQWFLTSRGEFCNFSSTV